MKKRQIVAILMLSPIYFSLTVQQRRDIVRKIYLSSLHLGWMVPKGGF